MNTSDSVQKYGSNLGFCDHIILHQVRTINPGSVVDFGAGGGKMGKLVRDAAGTYCHITAIEGFKDAAEMLSTCGIYNEVHHCLIQDYIAKLNKKCDVAIFGDVLEHLPPSDIRTIMRFCLQKFDHILINVPLHDIFQDPEYPNQLEIHQSYITERFFDRYRPCEKHIISSEKHGKNWTMMNVHVQSHLDAPSSYQRVVSTLLHYSIVTVQPFGFGRPLVDLLRNHSESFRSILNIFGLRKH